MEAVIEGEAASEGGGCQQKWRLPAGLEAASKGKGCHRRWRLLAKLELQTKVEAANLEAANEG